MLAGNVKLGGIIPVELDGLTTHGIRLAHHKAEIALKVEIPDNIIPVLIHHPRNLKQAIVGVDNMSEFEIDPNDINPYRQRN